MAGPRGNRIDPTADAVTSSVHPPRTCHLLRRTRVGRPRACRF